MDFTIENYKARLGLEKYVIKDGVVHGITKPGNVFARFFSETTPLDGVSLGKPHAKINIPRGQPFDTLDEIEKVDIPPGAKAVASTQKFDCITGDMLFSVYFFYK